MTAFSYKVLSGFFPSGYIPQNVTEMHVTGLKGTWLENMQVKRRHPSPPFRPAGFGTVKAKLQGLLIYYLNACQAGR